MIGPRAHIIDTIITQFSKVYIMYIPSPILNLKWYGSHAWFATEWHTYPNMIQQPTRIAHVGSAHIILHKDGSY